MNEWIELGFVAIYIFGCLRWAFRWAFSSLVASEQRLVGQGYGERGTIPVPASPDGDHFFTD